MADLGGVADDEEVPGPRQPLYFAGAPLLHQFPASLVSEGQGLNVTPLQAVMAVGALANGGYLIPPTFLKRSEEEARAMAKKVVRSETSDKMRYLMRLNVEKGTASRAKLSAPAISRCGARANRRM